MWSYHKCSYILFLVQLYLFAWLILSPVSYVFSHYQPLTLRKRNQCEQCGRYPLIFSLILALDYLRQRLWTIYTFAYAGFFIYFILIKWDHIIDMYILHFAFSFHQYFLEISWTSWCGSNLIFYYHGWVFIIIEVIRLFFQKVPTFYIPGPEMVENGPFPSILFDFCQAHGYRALTHFSELEHVFTYLSAVCVCARADSLFITCSFENAGLLMFSLRNFTFLMTGGRILCSFICD